MAVHDQNQAWQLCRIADQLFRIANVLEAQEKRTLAAEQVARDMDALGFARGDEPCG